MTMGIATATGAPKHRRETVYGDLIADIYQHIVGTSRVIVMSGHAHSAAATAAAADDDDDDDDIFQPCTVFVCFLFRKKNPAAPATATAIHTETLSWKKVPIKGATSQHRN